MTANNEAAAQLLAMTETERFARNLHELAAHHHEETANGLERLMRRLGPEGLGDEWNAVVAAKSNERIEGWRRAQAAKAIEARATETDHG